MPRSLHPFVLNRAKLPTGPIRDYRAVERPEDDDPKDLGTSEPLAEEQLLIDVPTPTPSTPSSESAREAELQASSSAGDAPSPTSAKPSESPTGSRTESGEGSTSTTEPSVASVPSPTIPTPTSPVPPVTLTQPLIPGLPTPATIDLDMPTPVSSSGATTTKKASGK